MEITGGLTVGGEEETIPVSYTHLNNNGEPNAKAVIFGFTQMLNEGIEIDNEDNGTDTKP